jgi:hypothetical protein
MTEYFYSYVQIIRTGKTNIYIYIIKITVC